MLKLASLTTATNSNSTMQNLPILERDDSNNDNNSTSTPISQSASTVSTSNDNNASQQTLTSQNRTKHKTGMFTKFLCFLKISAIKLF